MPLLTPKAGDYAELIVTRPGQRTKPGQHRASLTIRVKILETRTQMFGRLDCLIAPLAGYGEQWVSADSLNPLTARLEDSHV